MGCRVGPSSGCSAQQQPISSIPSLQVGLLLMCRVSECHVCFRQVQFHTGEAQCSFWLFLLCDTGSRFTARTGLEPWILLPQPRVLDLQVCTTVDLGPSLSLIQRDVCRVPRWLSSFEGNQSNSFCSTSVWQEFKLGELVPLLNKATRKWGCLARPVS